MCQAARQGKELRVTKMKPAEAEAHRKMFVHLQLLRRQTERLLEVLEGDRAAVCVKGDLPGTKPTGNKPPFSADEIDFLDDAVCNMIGDAMAVRIALGQAALFAKTSPRDRG
jgi:hypothetical protein